MKKMIGLITLATSAITGFAQWQGGPQNQGGYYQQASLIVNTSSQRQVSVVIDNNQTYQGNNNNGYGNTINIGTLSEGSHSIAVYEWRTNIFGKPRQELIYNSTVYLKSGYETTISVNSYGQANVSERQLYGYNDNNNGYGNNGNGVDWGYGRKKHKHHRKCGNDNGYGQRQGGWNNYGRRNQQNDDWDD